MTNALAAKTIVVTGATQGIGLATATALAQRGVGHLILLGRNAEKLEAARIGIRQLAPATQVTCHPVNLSLITGVSEVASVLLAQSLPIDVLVNNAGAYFSKREMTQEHFENTWALNHLAYVNLTLQLMPQLLKASRARVVNVSSRMHKEARLDFDNVQGALFYTPSGAYALSKLCNVMFTYALARRLRGTTVTAHCLHPGAVNTGFARGGTGFFARLFNLARPFFLSPQNGARTSVYLATAEQVEPESGGYFDRCRAVSSSRISYDESLQEKLWSLSLAQLGLNEPAFT